MTRAIIGAFTLAVTAAYPLAGANDRLITNASNVRLRHAPTTDAAIAIELPLGTELIALEQTNGAEPWYHVRTDAGHDGWVFGPLTTALDPSRRDQIVESIVEARLRTSGSFSTNVQLVDFIERSVARLRDRDARGRFAMYRLRSLSAAFGSIPFGVFDREVETKRPEAEPYGSRIRARLDAARYFESAGQWMVDPEYVKAVHSEHRDSKSGEGIAWFYVTNGLFGECEGDVPCYVYWQNELNGWYLASCPRGRHADESNADIEGALNGAMDNLLGFPRVLAEFDPKTRCGELHNSLDSLAAAVKASTSARKADALAVLDRYARLCH
jgi:SH3 domain-containing protein